MKVKELIALLKQYDQDMIVECCAYEEYEFNAVCVVYVNEVSGGTTLRIE